MSDPLAVRPDRDPTGIHVKGVLVGVPRAADAAARAGRNRSVPLWGLPASPDIGCPPGVGWGAGLRDADKRVEGGVAFVVWQTRYYVETRQHYRAVCEDVTTIYLSYPIQDVSPRGGRIVVEERGLPGFRRRWRAIFELPKELEAWSIAALGIRAVTERGGIVTLRVSNRKTGALATIRGNLRSVDGGLSDGPA